MEIKPCSLFEDCGCIELPVAIVSVEYSHEIEKWGLCERHHRAWQRLERELEAPVRRREERVQ